MDKLQELRERLGRLAELSVAEIETLKADVAAYFDEVAEGEATPENVQILQELGNGITAIFNREGEIEKANEKAEADKEAARKIRAALDGDPNDGDPGDGEGDDDSDGDGEPTDVEGKVPVTAAGRRQFRSSPSRMSRGAAPARISPTTTQRGGVSLVASAGGHGKSAGAKFEDKWELANYTRDVLKSLNPTAANGKVIIATADWRDQYPEERRLTDNSLVNAKLMDAVSSLSALAASGGTSLPANVDYALEIYASPARQVKTALAQFLCDRGALTFRQPPTLASLASSAGVWTEATDANPDGATKALFVVPVPSAETVYVNAITTRLQFGNLMGQFDPETIAANTEYALAAAARVAETELQSLIAAACVADVTYGPHFGAARDIFSAIDLFIANLRYTHRLDDSTIVNVMLPAYVKNMIRADRLNELAHDNAGSDVFALTDQWIDDAFALRGIEPIWTMDALPVDGSVYPSQQFSGFTASAAMPAYPAKVAIHAFIKGTMQFLDGGMLSLGVVRDATLDSTNDYETFSETFEGLAYRGATGQAVQCVLTLNVNGSSSEGIAYS